MADRRDRRTRVTRALERVSRFAATNRSTVFAAVIALLVVAGGSAATSVHMSMGMELYIDDDSQVNADWQELQSEFGVGNEVFVVVESERLYHPETIRAIDRLDERYADLDRFTYVTSLADVVKAGNGGEIPETEAGVKDAIDRVESQGDTSETFVGNLNPDEGTALVVLTYGNTDVPAAEDRFFGFLPGTEEGVITDAVTAETEAASIPSDMELTVTGSPIFENAAFSLMLTEMIKLFAVAFAIIFLVVYLVMRNRLERTWTVFLPVGTAMVALFYMMGMMGFAGYQFNAIMLGVMPIALGLGIDYSLQIQTRYVEERRAGRSPVDAAGEAGRTTGRALTLAMGTTVVGLGALLVAPVPPVRQFGATAAFSVVAAMALSVTFLIALLVTVDRDQYETDAPAGANAPRAVSNGGPGRAATTSAEAGLLEAFFGRFADGISARPLLVLVVLVAGVAGGAAAYSSVSTTQEMLDYWPDIQERQDMEALSDITDSPNVVYVIVEADDAYTPETFEAVSAFESEMESHPDVNVVMSPVTAVEMATDGEIPDDRAQLDDVLDRQEDQELLQLGERSDHPEKILVTMYAGDIEGKEIRALIEDTDAAADATIPDERVAVTGKPVLNRNVIENVTAGLTRMTILSFSLGILFLTLALRSLRRSLLLILSVAASAVLLVAGAMYLLDLPWNPLTIATASIVLGVGVDYGLHVYERYREEVVERGARPTDAIRTAMIKLSRPVLGSGLTTMLGFGALAISDFPVLANFGKVIAIAMGLALLTTFTILPAATLLLARRGGSGDNGQAPASGSEAPAAGTD